MPSNKTKSIGAVLPEGALVYKRTSTFTEETLPTGLTKAHATKAGVWAVIEVTSGRLRYREPETGVDVVLDEKTVAVAGPEEVHCIAPIGNVAFSVTFWRLPGDT